jgi:hypothetical protein
MVFWDGKEAHVIAALCAYTALAVAIAQIVQHLRYYSSPTFQVG